MPAFNRRHLFVKSVPKDSSRGLCLASAIFFLPVLYVRENWPRSSREKRMNVVLDLMVEIKVNNSSNRMKLLMDVIALQNTKMEANWLILLFVEFDD